MDFYYSVADEAAALFVDEITVAAARHPSLKLHLIRTDRSPAMRARR